MDKTFENIINEGKKNGKKLSEINAELKAAGATFHLDYTMTPDGPQTGCSEAEMEEGFLPAAEGEVEVPKHLHDYMRRDPAKANTEEEVWVPEGHYRITFDEDGHATKAVRING